ncbi:MAG: type IV pilin-like G/H family protein [Cyanobacteria bacterium P01_G01_bin.39]
MDKYSNSKLLNYFLKRSNQAQSSGFTLIELLVVVIIVGVLAAVALPNFLRQAGRARETEIKNAIGTVNRSQQAYHFEQQEFAPTEADMGINIPTQYINNMNIIANAAVDATVRPENTDATNDGTRGYSGGIYYIGGAYNQILCQTVNVANQASLPTNATTCGGTDTVIR